MRARGVSLRTLRYNAVGAANVVNSGYIVASAYANALAYGTDNRAEAGARATGIYQHVDGWLSGYTVATPYAYIDQPGLSASASVLNNGHIVAKAFSTANAYLNWGDAWNRAEASATAVGVSQHVSNALNLSATVTNNTSAVIYALANASAHAGSTYVGPGWEAGHARANAYATGVSQHAWNGGTAQLNVYNNGLIRADAIANADSTAIDGDAHADAAAIGVYQKGAASGDTPEVLTANVTNYALGTIVAHATASATAPEDARAHGTATGVYQDAWNVPSAHFGVENYGVIKAVGKAYAYSTYEDARAYGNAVGVAQRADDSGSVFGVVNNYASSYIVGSAYAHASAPYDHARAEAWAAGVDQNVEFSGGNIGLFLQAADFTVLNSGVIHAFASGYAVSAFDDARATGSAIGVHQGAEQKECIDGDYLALGGDIHGQVTNNTGARIAATAWLWQVRIGMQQRMAMPRACHRRSTCRSGWGMHTLGRPI